MRVWICESPRYPSGNAYLYMKEPKWGRWGGVEGWSGVPQPLYRKDIQRLLGRTRIPKWPLLLEVELTARVVETWEPDEPLP